MVMWRPPDTAVETPGAIMGRMVALAPKTLTLLTEFAGEVTRTGRPSSKVKKLPTLHPPTTWERAPWLAKGLFLPKGSSYWPLARRTLRRSCAETERSQEGQ